MSMYSIDWTDDRVSIYAEDESKYQEVALLVDRPDFLEAMVGLRLEFEIYPPLVDVSTHTSVFDGKAIWARRFGQWKDDNPSDYKRLKMKIEGLLFRLHKPWYLLETVFQVMFFKFVIDVDGLVRVLGSYSTFDNTTIGIFPNTNTSDQEIINAWREVQDWFKRDPKSFMPKERHKNIKSEFRRNRKWYWRNVRGESYTDIALSLESKDVQADFKRRKKQGVANTGRDELTYLSMVRESVRKYKRLLDVDDE